MLVCHNNMHFEDHRYERGDTVSDPALEERIKANPNAAQHFTTAVHPVDPAPVPAWTSGPAWAPRVGLIPEDPLT